MFIISLWVVADTSDTIISAVPRFFCVELFQPKNTKVMETHDLHPHNTEETPLTDRGHYTLLNLVKYYSRFIANEDKNILLLDLLKDAALLDRLRKGDEDYINVPVEEKLSFYKTLSYFFRKMDKLLKNEGVKDWIWTEEGGKMPHRLKK